MNNPDKDNSKRAVGAAMARGFIGRCPACGRGAVLNAYLSPVATCGVCGENLAPYQAADFAPYSVTFLVGLIFTPLTVMAAMREGANNWVLAALVGAALVSALLLLPRAKGAAIGMLWALDVHNV